MNKGYVLNWDEPIDWQNEDIFDTLYNEFYFQGSDRSGTKQIDTRKLNSSTSGSTSKPLPRRAALITS